MFNISGSELAFLLIVALVILGPERLPSALRSFGRTYGEFKKMAGGFQSELKEALDEPMREIIGTADAFKNAANFEIAADFLEGKTSAPKAPDATTPATAPAVAPATPPTPSPTPAAADATPASDTTAPSKPAAGFGVEFLTMQDGAILSSPNKPVVPPVAAQPPSGPEPTPIAEPAVAEPAVAEPVAAEPVAAESAVELAVDVERLAGTGDEAATQ